MDLEQPLLRPPFEGLQKVTRQAQKNVEHTMKEFEKNLQKVVDYVRDPTTERKEVVLTLDTTLIHPLKELRNKLEMYADQSDGHARVLAARARHITLREKVNPKKRRTSSSLDDMDTGDPTEIAGKENLPKPGEPREEKDMKDEEPADIPHLERKKDQLPNLERMEIGDDSDEKSTTVEEWNKTRLNRVIVDHLLREGCMKTATKMSIKLGLEDLVELMVFKVAQEVIDGLKNHNCTRALAWCGKYRSKLKRLESEFEFHCRAQEFIELIRSGKGTPASQTQGDPPALVYAQKHFQSEMSSLHRFREYAGVLSMYDPKQEKCLNKKYEKYFAPERWDDLISEFYLNLFEVHGMTHNSLMDITLQSGFAAIKAQACDVKDEYNPNCPACSPVMRNIGKTISATRRSRTSLVCRITGEVMDSDNPPMALPNGYVYSKKALESMPNPDKIKCPRTGKVFRLTDCKTVFII